MAYCLRWNSRSSGVRAKCYVSPRKVTGSCCVEGLGVNDDLARNTAPDERNFAFIATLGEVPPGRGIVRTIDGLEVLICNVAQQIHIVENRCSHMNKPLGQGKLSGFLVTCPFHAGQFDIRDGSPRCFPASRPIRTFQARVIDNQIWISPCAAITQA